MASTERARLQWVQWTRPTGSLAEQQPWPGPTSVGLITTGRPGLQRLDAWKEVERRWGSQNSVFHLQCGTNQLGGMGNYIIPGPLRPHNGLEILRFQVKARSELFIYLPLIETQLFDVKTHSLGTQESHSTKMAFKR